jgi:hypothetical protein
VLDTATDVYQGLTGVRPLTYGLLVAHFDDLVTETVGQIVAHEMRSRTASPQAALPAPSARDELGDWIDIARSNNHEEVHRDGKTGYRALARGLGTECPNVRRDRSA